MHIFLTNFMKIEIKKAQIHRGRYTPSYPYIPKRLNNYSTIAKSTDIFPHSSSVFTPVPPAFACNGTLSLQYKTVDGSSTGTLKCFIQSNVFFSFFSKDRSYCPLVHAVYFECLIILLWPSKTVSRIIV